jgi:CBS domain-containing protein
MSLNDSKLQSGISVDDIMTKALITVNPSTTCYQIAKMMEQAGIGAIIVSDMGNPIGIITDRDFAIKIAVNKYPLDSPVQKIMSSPLIVINSDDSVYAAAHLMAEKKIRKLAVAKNGKIIGIVTSSDLVNQIAKKKDI